MGGRCMTMLGFQELTCEAQITILYQYGLYIGKKKISGLISLLFQVESFYVEIIYANYRKSIHKIHCTDSTLILDQYPDQIDVECLIG